MEYIRIERLDGCQQKGFFLQTMAMQAQIVNGMYVFIYYFFNLFIYFYEEYGKRGNWRLALGRTHLDLFIYGAAFYMCFFFSFGSLLAHTRRERISVAQTARMG